MKHAHAWADATYPGCLKIEAQPRRGYIPGRGVINMGEDIWGVFDLVVFPMHEGIDLVQITTLNAKGHVSNATPRKAKVQAWIFDVLPTHAVRHRTDLPGWLWNVRVMGWVPRKHFRCWLWDWMKEDWVETDPIPARLSLARQPQLAQARAQGQQEIAQGSQDHESPF